MDSPAEILEIHGFTGTQVTHTNAAPGYVAINTYSLKHYGLPFYLVTMVIIIWDTYNSGASSFVILQTSTVGFGTQIFDFTSDIYLMYFLQFHFVKNTVL